MKLQYNEVKNSILDVKVDKRTEVYNWGTDNAYPSTMEYLLNASVTAKNAVDKSAKAIFGKGVKTNGHTIVNSKGHSLNDVIRTLVREYVKHNNAFLSVSYNLLGEVSAIEVIPSKNVRLGKRDDTGYNGKFIIYSNWDKKDGKIDKDSFQVVDRYNPNKEIIQSQIEKKGIQKYKGQIVHLQKYMNELYSLADGDCVILDMLAEINAGQFKQKGTTDGFLNTKIMAVQPFNSDEERRAFKRDLDSVKGSKNANSVILLESSSNKTELANQILLQDLTSEHNDALFQYTESSSERSIAKAFNVPIALINPSDNGLFAGSGEMYKTVKDIMLEEREEERAKIEEILTEIMYNFKKPFEEPVEILTHKELEEPKVESNE
jgi:capsid portal protein